MRTPPGKSCCSLPVFPGILPLTIPQVVADPISSGVSLDRELPKGFIEKFGRMNPNAARELERQTAENGTHEDTTTPIQEDSNWVAHSTESEEIFSAVCPLALVNRILQAPRSLHWLRRPNRTRWP